jgi:hypothetical protein
MKKRFPEGFYWVRNGMGPISQEVASYFEKIATTCTASVRREHRGPISQEVASYFEKIATRYTVTVSESNI